MPKRKTKRDYWSLRKGDLPSPSAIAAAEPLRDLENNALFRLYLFTERDRSGFGRSIVIYVARFLFIGVIALLFYCGFFLSGFGQLAFLFVFSTWSFWFRSAFRPRRDSVLGLGNLAWHDLILTGLSPSDMAGAVWGLVVGRWAIIHVAIVRAVFLLLFWFGLLFSHQITKWILLPVLFAVAARIAMMAFIPHNVLPSCLDAVLLQRKYLEYQRRPFKATMGFVMSATRIILAVAAFLIAFIGAVFLFNRSHFYTAFPFDLVQAPLWFLGALINTILGAGAGWARGLYIRKHANQYLDLMTQNIRAIMEMVMEREEREVKRG